MLNEFKKLDHLINLVVQRCNLKVIDGFQNLGHCEDRLDLEFEDMKVNLTSFKNFESVNRIIIIAKKHDSKFSWLGDLKLQCIFFSRSSAIKKFMQNKISLSKS